MSIEHKEGVKFDSEKPDFSHLDFAAIIEAAEVMAFGAKKYGKGNWKKGLAYSRLLNAILRHTLAMLQDKQELDPESGKSHLAHIICNCIMLHYTIYRLPNDEFNDIGMYRMQ